MDSGVSKLKLAQVPVCDQNLGSHNRCHLDRKPLGLRATTGIGIKVRRVAVSRRVCGVNEGRNSVLKHSATLMYAD